MAGPLGSTPGIIVGVGVGAAASTALEPALELPKQDAWSRNRNRILDPAVMARLVAQGGVDLGAARDDAHRDGLTDDKLDALVYLSQTVPGFAAALALWRRNPDTFAELWRHALVKNGIDARYFEYLDQLKTDRLSPPVVALAIVRGILKDPGFLPVGPPSTEGKVKAFPTSPLDALDESAAFGFDRDRLFVQTAISGRPMAPDAAANAVFRKILERVDYDRAISEGDIRNEWADAIFESSRQIPTAHTFVEGRLRGWLTDDEMYAGAARHGQSKADTHIDFLVSGRPPSWHQIWIGLQRGGVYDGPQTDIHPAFLKGLQESNLRPEWYNLLWHSRYTYPSAFVLRALAQAGDIDPDTLRDILKFIGWEPSFIEKVVARWTGGTAAKADPHIAKAQTQLWTATHRAYVVSDTDDAGATEALTALGVAAAAIPEVLTLWQAERALIRKDLGKADVKKLYVKGIVNRDTGSPWTRDDAVAQLVQLGYSLSEANEFLDL